MTDKDEIKFAIRYLKQGLKSKRTPPLYEELMKELGFIKKDKVQGKDDKLTKAKKIIRNLLTLSMPIDYAKCPEPLQKIAEAEQFLNECEE